MKRSLYSFFKISDAVKTDENQETKPDTTEATAPTEQPEGAEDDDEEEENQDGAEGAAVEVEQPEVVEGQQANASAEVVQMRSISEADYTTLVADAASWNKNKAEYENLKQWHAKSTGQTTIGADANASGAPKKSWEKASWNQ